MGVLLQTTEVRRRKYANIVLVQDLVYRTRNKDRGYRSQTATPTLSFLVGGNFGLRIGRQGPAKDIATLIVRPLGGGGLLLGR